MFRGILIRVGPYVRIVLFADSGTAPVHQDMMLGVDLVGEERMDQLLGPKKEKRKRDWFRRRFGGGEIKEEDFEAAPAWERTASEAPESPIDLSR